MQHVDPDRLALLALGERMDPHDEDELTGHLAGCPVCQQEVRALRATVDLARETVGYRDDTITPPAGVWTGIVAELGLDVSSPPLRPPGQASGPAAGSVDGRSEPTGGYDPEASAGSPPGSSSDLPPHPATPMPGSGGAPGDAVPGWGADGVPPPGRHRAGGRRADQGGDPAGGASAGAGDAGSGGYAGPGSSGGAAGAGSGGYVGPGSYGEAGGAGSGGYVGPGPYGQAGEPVEGVGSGAGRAARRRGSRSWPRRAVALAAAAAVGVLGTVVAIRPWTDDAPAVKAASTAVLDPVAGGPTNVHGQATVMQTPAGPELRVSTSGLPLQTGFYQVWVFDGKTRMQAVGVLGKDATATFPLPATLDLNAFSIVDISLEPYDGDQTHSKESVLRGTLTS